VTLILRQLSHFFSDPHNFCTVRSAPLKRPKPYINFKGNIKLCFPV
jgi:hypothetical protein